VRFLGEPDGPAKYPARYHISNCHTSLPQVVASAPRPAFQRGETGKCTVSANRTRPLGKWSACRAPLHDPPEPREKGQRRPED